MKEMILIGLGFFTLSSAFAAPATFIKGDPAIQLFDRMTGPSVKSANGVRILILDSENRVSLECDRESARCTLNNEKNTIDTEAPAYSATSKIVELNGAEALSFYGNVTGWNTSDEIELEDFNDCSNETEYYTASYDRESNSVVFKNGTGFKALICSGG